MSYGIIFWGKSLLSSIVLRLQKKAIRIMEGCGNRVSCRNLFKKLDIFAFDITIYVTFINVRSSKKNNFFLTNNESQNIDARQRNNLYLPQANLTIYQKGAYYLGIKIFNNLPLEVKIVADNQKKFKLALKKFLYTYTFHTMEEYLIHELCTILQNSLLQWYIDLRFCLWAFG
jgi:hypothetical protein